MRLERWVTAHGVAERTIHVTFQKYQSYLGLAAGRGGTTAFKIKGEHQDHSFGLCGSLDGRAEEALVGAAAIGSAGAD